MLRRPPPQPAGRTELLPRQFPCDSGSLDAKLVSPRALFERPQTGTIRAVAGGTCRILSRTGGDSWIDPFRPYDVGATKSMDKLVLIKDIPSDTKDEIQGAIAPFTIAFLRDAPSGDGSADLVGSGVLVSAGGHRAILTAAHVLDAIPSTPRIGLLLGQTNHIESIDRGGVSVVTIARGREDALGPDLGIIRLAPSIASAVAARKVFYNLDARREQVLNDPPDLRDGVWCVQGFLGEHTSVADDRDGGGKTKYFYNFTGFGGPDNCIRRDGFDYFDFPVEHEARAESPVSWGGMSGGGMWQVRLKRDSKALTREALFLAGVLYYQVATTPTSCGVIGHGRESVYAKAYDAIVEP